MKLINQFTIWYLGITLLVLLAGGLIIYHHVHQEIDKEEARDIHAWLDDVAKRIAKGVPVKKLNRAPVQIKLIDPDLPVIPFKVMDTIAMHRQLERPERQLKGSASYKIEGRHYYISTYDIMVESDDIVHAVRRSMIWIIGLLLVFVAVTSRLISNQILRPFHKTLQAIKSFRLNQQRNLQLEPVTTNELATLNNFLLSMTMKAQEDYSSLKEFTENASHEMQTPLAIIRGKLELLMESEIKDDQAKLILSAHDAVEKLSRMGQALTLLTKLSNQEFQTREPINLSVTLKNTLTAFHDLMEMKSLSVTTQIDDDVHIDLNQVLADILLNNLFSNAIRHNLENGAIRITLTATSFQIQNTGTPPAMDTMELFKRFKKGNQSGDSIGLGLAIVKQICDLNRFSISYTFHEDWHRLEIKF